MKSVWRWLKTVPLGLWAALGVAVTILMLFLRGRRLEAELARAKVDAEAAGAKAEVARLRGAANVHVEQAAKKAEKVAKLEEVRAIVREQGDTERAKLAKLSPKELDAAYLELARSKLPTLKP